MGGIGCIAQSSRSHCGASSPLHTGEHREHGSTTVPPYPGAAEHSARTDGVNVGACGDNDAFEDDGVAEDDDSDEDDDEHGDDDEAEDDNDEAEDDGDDAENDFALVDRVDVATSNADGGDGSCEFSRLSFASRVAINP